jgi:hypothetical protein
VTNGSPVVIGGRHVTSEGPFPGKIAIGERIAAIGVGRSHDGVEEVDG